MKKILFFVMVLSFTVSLSHAQTQWDVVAGRSSVNFKVKHFIFSNVEGKFKNFEGKMITPDEGLENAQLEAYVKTSSIYTGNSDRDTHLNSADFFASTDYPEMFFKSRSIVKGNQENTFNITGDLTIRGVTKTVELIADYEGVKTLANGKTRMDFTAIGKINRFDYGLRWNELLETGKAVVGENVQISLDISLFKSSEEKPTEVAVDVASGTDSKT